MTQTATQTKKRRTKTAKPEVTEDIAFTVEDVEEDIVGPPSGSELEESFHFRGPLMASPEWPDFVMAQFTEDEVDEDGSPYIHGLRRVTRLLLGNVMESRSQMVQSPHILGPGKQEIAVASHQIQIDVIREGIGLVVIEDVGDVSQENSPNFAKWAARTASTQAEARCLRKLLMLRRNTIAAEEKDKSGAEILVSKQVLNVIDLICSKERLDINIKAYLDLGKTKFSSPERIPMNTALRAIEHLDDIQRGVKPVPEGVSGYDSQWRENWKTAS